MSTRERDQIEASGCHTSDVLCPHTQPQTWQLPYCRVYIYKPKSRTLAGHGHFPISSCSPGRRGSAPPKIPYFAPSQHVEASEEPRRCGPPQCQPEWHPSRKHPANILGEPPAFGSVTAPGGPRRGHRVGVRSSGCNRHGDDGPDGTLSASLRSCLTGTAATVCQWQAEPLRAASWPGPGCDRPGARGPTTTSG